MFIKCSQHLLQYGDSIDAVAAGVWCYSSLMKWRKIQHFTFDCSLLHNVWKLILYRFLKRVMLTCERVNGWRRSSLGAIWISGEVNVIMYSHTKLLKTNSNHRLTYHSQFKVYSFCGIFCCAIQSIKHADYITLSQKRVINMNGKPWSWLGAK